MQTQRIALAALLALCLAAPAAARVTDEEIQASIKRGVDYLLKAQNDKGWWTDRGYYSFSNDQYAGGDEVCAMLALAYAGVSMTDPKMQKGFDALLEFKMRHTYVVSMRIMVISKLLYKLDRERRERAWEVLRQDALFLARTQRDNGAWGYPRYEKDSDPPKILASDTWWDFSNTQMAILGLSEAINAGYEVSVDVMKKAQDQYLREQQSDGGWEYGAKLSSQPSRNKSYGSMTAAGVASLFITRDYIYRGLGCPCSGDRSSSRTLQVDKAIDGGLAWLAKYFVASKHPMAAGKDDVAGWLLYYLYACERVGLASGMKYFGGHDWYAEGAEYLVKKQRRTGDWGRFYDTAYAICFLVKGRAPILFNKLQFKGEWANHPRDAANLAAYVAKQKEQPIQWQIINLDAPVDEWHDAPILYISAESPLELTDDQKKKFRQFTDSGGTILFEASCGNRTAANAWRTLAKDVWPEWEMKRLDKDHPLFVADQDMSRGRLPILFGMDDGVRTFVLTSFADISCAWNTLAVTQQQPLFNLGSNLYAYTTDRRPLRARLAEKKTLSRTNYLEAKLQAGPRAALKLARVKHGGDWYVGQNYDPLGRLAAALAERSGLRLQAADAADPSALTVADAQVAHLTGRQGVTLGDAEAAALKKYLQAGGFLLAEAAMGDPRFDADFRGLAAQLGLELKALPSDDPLITGRLGAAAGYDVASVRYKYHLREQRIGKPLPLLHGLHQDGRLVGLYSPFDLVFSQTGFDAWACRGYEPEDALAILTNVLLLASTR